MRDIKYPNRYLFRDAPNELTKRAPMIHQRIRGVCQREGVTGCTLTLLYLLKHRKSIIFINELHYVLYPALEQLAQMGYGIR